MFTPRIGVYICHCGINIASTVDISALREAAAHLPGVIIARDYTYLCSDPGQVLIQNDIAELKLNRVVVAACSPLMHAPTFRSCLAAAGLNPYCLEIANIREQCAWVHRSGDQANHKAVQLVAAAVAKAARLQPLEERQVPVTPAALVIGGGMAGLQAALDIAEAGYQVTIVERAPDLGGHVAQLYQTFPHFDPATDLVNRLVEQVTRHPRIAVLTQAEVTGLAGYIGNFQAQVQRGSEHSEVTAGTIVVATGFQVFDARRKPELGYGVYPGVITSLDCEQLLNRGSDLSQLKSVVFIQCVGSRDQTLGNSFCSRVCCMVTAKQARLMQARLPQAQVTVFYMDVRAYGKGFEEFYDCARTEGVLYRRGNPSEIIRRGRQGTAGAQGTAGRQLVVRAEDTLLGELVEVEADLVVLAVGMEPQNDSASLAGLLKLSRSSDGFFMEAHPKLRPVDTALAGVFLAGCCQGPKDLSESITQARAAASAATIPLMRGHVTVDPATAFIDEELCSGCNQCAQVCSFSALALHPVRGVMTVNPVLCQGCGACATACPAGALNVHHSTFNQIIAQVEALSAQEVELPDLTAPGRTKEQEEAVLSWILATNGDPLRAVRNFLQQIWLQAGLDGLLVPLHREGDSEVELQLVRDPAQLVAADPFAPVMPGQAAGLMARLAGAPSANRPAAVLRSCEARALARIASQAATADSGVSAAGRTYGVRPGALTDGADLGHWLTIGVDCLGCFTESDFHWRVQKAGTAEKLTDDALRFARQGWIAPYRFRQACQMCSSPEATTTDLSIGLVGLPVHEYLLVTAKNAAAAAAVQLDQITAGPAPQAVLNRHAQTLAALSNRRTRTRERIFHGLKADFPGDAASLAVYLQQCSPCEQCLNACPFHGSALAPSAQPAQINIAAIRRWLAACVACGMCEQACPKEIPLTAIFGRIKQELSQD